jgi:hypothetical protein
MWPGSHDAGCYALNNANGYPNGPLVTGHAQGDSAITQTYSLLDQLCLGTRWFDLRITHHSGDWRVIHPNGLLKKNAVSDQFDSLANVLGQMSCFADAHPHELMILRIKFELINEARKVEALQMFFRAFGAQIITRTHPKANNLHTARFYEVVANGHVILQSYGGDGPTPAEDYGLAAVGGIQDADITQINAKMYRYSDMQSGTFSDAKHSQSVGEKQIEYTNAWHAGGKTKLHSFWWTATAQKPGGTSKLWQVNVQENTRKINKEKEKHNLAPAPTDGSGVKAKHYLPSLAKNAATNLANGETCLGNVLTVDFNGADEGVHVGVWTRVMQKVVFLANGLKFDTAPNVAAGTIVKGDKPSTC